MSDAPQADTDALTPTRDIADWVASLTDAQIDHVITAIGEVLGGEARSRHRAA